MHVTASTITSGAHGTRFHPAKLEPRQSSTQSHGSDFNHDFHVTADGGQDWRPFQHARPRYPDEYDQPES